MPALQRALLVNERRFSCLASRAETAGYAMCCRDPFSRNRRQCLNVYVPIFLPAGVEYVQGVDDAFDQMDRVDEALPEKTTEGGKLEAATEPEGAVAALPEE